ncbi:uncharacterized protein LOC131994122 isoform X2 [Stomoxys calcitrans]|uniref:uncharacterized protein LOC131994122 isoform X2 n=1 Tax=Stomoxys calcitrans TaxID=35570 RepID=UPI0027E238F8|nr:uncharacterized protein LOC131994122 isoform X2 [Stomoxys calcitrans]
MQGVLKNVDILLKIYRILDLDDQIRLSQVNENLKNVFEMFIFRKEDYSSVHVYASPPHFVVTNGGRRNRLLMKHHELMAFLCYHRLVVQTSVHIRGTILDVRPFKNLTSLSYSYSEVSREHARLLATIPLEKLEVNFCTNELGQAIMIGPTWSIEYLVAMTNLRFLKVTSISLETAALSFGEFMSIITKSKLQHIELNCIIVCESHLEDDAYKDSNANVVQLQHLNICVDFKLNKSIMPFMKLFVNLVTLSINVEDEPLTNEILLEFSRVCANLEKLRFERTAFENIRNYVVPAQLNELTLISCYGLSSDNFRQILNISHLKRFKTFNTYPEHASENLTTCDPSKDHLHFDGDAKDLNLEVISSGNSNLVSWIGMEFHNRDAANSHDNNSEVLDFEGNNLTLKTLYGLHSLHSLHFSMHVPSIPWLHVANIFRHSHLKEFALYFLHPNPEAMDVHAPTEGFTIGLRQLKMSWDIFKIALDFWLDLFDKNNQLQLRVREYTTDEHSYKSREVSQRTENSGYLWFSHKMSRFKTKSGG